MGARASGGAGGGGDALVGVVVMVLEVRHELLRHLHERDEGGGGVVRPRQLAQLCLDLQATFALAAGGRGGAALVGLGGASAVHGQPDAASYEAGWELLEVGVGRSAV